MPLPCFILKKEFIPIDDLVKNSKKLKLKANEIIYREGFQYDYFFWLVKGVVKISILSENGDEKILGFHENSLFGMDLWCKNSIAVVTATAYTDIEICYIPHDEMKKLIEKFPKLGMPLISYVSDIMRLMIFHMSSHVFLDAKTRIIDILYLYSQMGCNIEPQKKINITEQELAYLTGISRVHVARILKELRQNELISTRRNTIILLNEERLLELCRF